MNTVWKVVRMEVRENTFLDSTVKGHDSWVQE